MVKAVELQVTGNYFYNGAQVKSVRTTSYCNELLIEEEKLKELLRKSERCDALEKSQGHLMKLVQEGALSQRGSSGDSNDAEVESLKKELKEAQSEIADLKAKNEELQAWYAEPDFSDLRKELTKRSVEVRREKSRLATAVAVSASIKGSSTKEISAMLSERGLSSSSSFISKALSAKHEDGKERLRSIMFEYSDEFTGVEEADFEKWYDERHQKAVQAEQKEQMKWKIIRDLAPKVKVWVEEAKIRDAEAARQREF